MVHGETIIIVFLRKSMRKAQVESLLPRYPFKSRPSNHHWSPECRFMRRLVNDIITLIARGGQAEVDEILSDHNTTCIFATDGSIDISQILSVKILDYLLYIAECDFRDGLFVKEDICTWWD